MNHWGVSLWVPWQKSMGCRKTVRGVRLVEGRGTLRLTLEVSLRARGPFKEGSLTPSWAKMAKMTTIIVFLEKSLKIPVHNHVCGLVGLSGHQRGGQGHRCHGVARGRHQNAQKWAPPWAPPSTHKNEKIKMKKNEKNHYFLRGTNAVTLQLSNHDRKMMLWGRGVTHGGAQMWRR